MFKKIVGLWFSSKWKNAKDVKKYITSLVEWWATEFFTWYNPPEWYTRFWFEVSPNGRFSEHEQITDFETLRSICEEVHSHWYELFINLNAWYYTDETMPYIEKMVDDFIKIGIDWVICWNIGILEYLKKINYAWKINISTILALYNKEAIRFMLDNYNINKVILSREITLKEIESIVLEFPDILFEVFWEWDFCRYNNWLCYAEHKYWEKDICTVVVNDLIIKKKYRADFKKIILDDNLSNQEKIQKLDDTYYNIFEQIENIFREIDLWISDELELKNDLEKIIKISKNRVDLFFDALYPVNSTKNINILTYLKALKYLNNSDYDELKNEIEKSIRSWMNYHLQKAKQIWWEAKLKAYELANFYSKSDNLNLYCYLFFSKFKNIETVKFPTRWRNHNEKLKLITQVVENQDIEYWLIDRWVSIERAHYDLTYLFWDKLWFRKMLKDL